MWLEMQFDHVAIMTSHLDIFVRAKWTVNSYARHRKYNADSMKAQFREWISYGGNHWKSSSTVLFILPKRSWKIIITILCQSRKRNKFRNEVKICWKIVLSCCLLPNLFSIHDSSILRKSRLQKQKTETGCHLVQKCWSAMNLFE